MSAPRGRAGEEERFLEIARQALALLISVHGDARRLETGETAAEIASLAREIAAWLDAGDK